MLVTQSCPTLSHPRDCSLPGFSVHGIVKAGILEWVAIPCFTEIFKKVKQKINQMMLTCSCIQTYTKMGLCTY